LVFGNSGKKSEQSGAKNEQEYSGKKSKKFRQFSGKKTKKFRQFSGLSGPSQFGSAFKRILHAQVVVFVSA
jgi:hypothetical protein